MLREHDGDDALAMYFGQCVLEGERQKRVHADNCQECLMLELDISEEQANRLGVREMRRLAKIDPTSRKLVMTAQKSVHPIQGRRA